METGGCHRKSVRHLSHPGLPRELTFSCYRRFPLLADDRWKDLLSESIDASMASAGFQLIAFVYMPEHVHLIVMPCDEESDVSRLLKAIKRPHSFRVKQAMMLEDNPWLGRLMVRERRGVTVFRFWQEGSGYDRAISSGSTLREAADYLHANPVRRGLCDSAATWRWSSWHAIEGGVSFAGLPRVDPRVETELR